MDVMSIYDVTKNTLTWRFPPERVQVRERMSRNDKHGVALCVFEKGKLIGTAGLASGMLWYSLHRDRWGNGFGTEVAEGKETREFDGKMYVLEHAFKADFSFVKAWKGDAAGNLIFKGTARNFNPNMCGAAKITVAEVEELVPVGTLDPNQIHIPVIFIQRIFQGKDYEKRIEQRTLTPKP